MKRSEDVESPVGLAMIFVCEKCGKQVAKDSGEEENAAKRLQKAVKKESKRLGDKRAVRAVLTGCLGVCPDDALTVAIASLHSSARFLTIDPDGDFESAAAKLVQLASENTKSQTPRR